LILRSKRKARLSSPTCYEFLSDHVRLESLTYD